jgi:eukaryotic-like serine/threonine-protein kinase
MSVKLRGFSLATLDDADEYTAVVSFGSSVYMAPEQFKGHEATPATDLFSLVVVIYELLIGVHPFMSNVISAIGQKITKKAHTPLRTLHQGAPTVLEHILDRALKKHPARRYQTALDLAGDLGFVLDDIAPQPQEQSDQQRLTELKNLSFFAEFSNPDIFEIIAVSLWSEFEPGECTILDGDPGESFYIVLHGAVDLIKDGVHIARLKRGDCFGEISFTTRGDRSASAQAHEFVTTIEIRARLVERIKATSQIRFQRAFLEIMAARLTRATAKIAQLST